MHSTATAVNNNDFTIELERDQVVLIRTVDGQIVKYSNVDAKLIRIVSPLSFLATHDIQVENKTIILTYRCNIFPCIKTEVLPDGFPQTLELELQRCLQHKIESELTSLTRNHPPSNCNKWVPFSFQFTHFETPLFIEVINLAR